MTRKTLIGYACVSIYGLTIDDHIATMRRATGMQSTICCSAS
jgi:hypothetical protein